MENVTKIKSECFVWKRALMGKQVFETFKNYYKNKVDLTGQEAKKTDLAPRISEKELEQIMK